MDVIPIGRFSALTGLSVKALRHYDEVGLLKPITVDTDTGYRYYSLGQANRAEAIRLLRSLDMPLDEVRAVLDAADAAAVQDQLGLHRRRIRERLAREEHILAFLERLIERGEVVMEYDVKTKEVPAQLVASLRARTSLRDIGSVLNAGLGEVMAHVGSHEAPFAGPPFVVYHDTIDELTDGDIEICAPVSRTVPDGERVRGAELPGGPVAWTVHKGPYSEIRPAYHALYAWMDEHGHTPSGPPREIYLTDPHEVPDPANFVTEIDWPIG